MISKHSSEIFKEEFDTVSEPENYEEQLLTVFNMISSSFELNIFNIQGRVKRLESEMENVKIEIQKLNKSDTISSLEFLSQKLKSQGTYAVLKDEVYEILLITDSKRKALNFCSDKKGVFILRLK